MIPSGWADSNPSLNITIAEAQKDIPKLGQLGISVTKLVIQVGPALVNGGLSAFQTVAQATAAGIDPNVDEVYVQGYILGAQQFPYEMATIDACLKAGTLASLQKLFASIWPYLDPTDTALGAAFNLASVQAALKTFLAS